MFGDIGEEESDDPSFDPHECESEGGQDERDDEEPDNEEWEPDDEERFSRSRFWSPQLKALLKGSMEGGDPHSHTGLLVGVAPMLLHSTSNEHPERPARMVAIYHELVEQGLIARARLVPARVASMEDLALVHDQAQVCASHRCSKLPCESPLTSLQLVSPL